MDQRETTENLGKYRRTNSVVQLLGKEGYWKVEIPAWKEEVSISSKA